nr:haloacid dehalogenase-like hydrolase family protein [Tanacetum cinerariifolium]
MLEIVPVGSRKGNEVRMLLDHFVVAPNEVMAIDVGEDEIEMIELALGIALSNGKGNEVRMLLDHFVVAPNEVMAIDVGENEIEMIELASLGKALSNESEN